MKLIEFEFEFEFDLGALILYSLLVAFLFFWLGAICLADVRADRVKDEAISKGFAEYYVTNKTVAFRWRD